MIHVRTHSTFPYSEFQDFDRGQESKVQGLIRYFNRLSNEQSSFIDIPVHHNHYHIVSSLLNSQNIPINAEKKKRVLTTSTNFVLYEKNDELTASSKIIVYKEANVYDIEFKQEIVNFFKHYKVFIRFFRDLAMLIEVHVLMVTILYLLTAKLLFNHRNYYSILLIFIVTMISLTFYLGKLKV
ncbi:unnamed protein product [Didymodactylos carnosus]|uniref:Uncharacterized protein n=1 Tax=Didymodactylos carnosus TaxID=1234261 RepID=A0A814EIY0_9BILA|nr:unnamed protein product [Didymodactylos carnosus]CAF0972907.1 unnamed protein product [Didymodactylos carnosus]CAF3570234.1 unnamed protein product [Didymodactylos carnosus]CAF3745842.1 unnamed protein product [Didymodactylos carnosus]